MRAVITGGTHGIGAAIAKNWLLYEGTEICVVGRSVDKFNEFAKSLTQWSLSRTTFIQGDITEKETRKVIGNVIRTWGGIEVLVNNVGGGGRWGTEDPQETDMQVWKEVFDKNLFAAVELTNMCLPYMLEKQYGRVISIASNYGKEMLPGGRPWFIAAKAALIAYMKAMSKQTKYVSNGITFNTVSPGPLMIPGTGWDVAQKDDPDTFLKFITDNIPAGFMAGEDQVVEVLSLLWRSKYINGENIVVDGGMSNSY